MHHAFHPPSAGRLSRASTPRRCARRLCSAVAVLACLLWSAGAQAAVATPDGGYSPTRVLVKYATAGAAGPGAHAAGVSEEGSSTPLGAGTRVVNLARGEPVSSALARLRRRPDVAWAVPDYRAPSPGARRPNG